MRKGRYMKIGQLAKLTDTQVVTIRYYEKEGLLGAPERTGSNYRVYGEKDIERLQFIRHCRRHGMGLSEIRALLAYRDAPKADCVWIMEMIQTHITRVDEQMASLAHLKVHLEQLRDSCSGAHAGESCGIIQSLGEWEPCKLCGVPGSGSESGAGPGQKKTPAATPGFSS